MLAPIRDCPVLTAPNRATLAALRARLPEPAWRPRGARLTVLAIDDRTPGQVVVDGAVPFRQGNDAQNEALKAWLAQQLANDPPAFALELFAGAGNLTEVLAAAGVARVMAVEGDAAACSALGARRLPGVEVVCADLRDSARLRALARSAGEAELLLLDPPRDGFRALPALLAALPRLARILYVSCDLATFARDAAGAVAQGFALRVVQPFDFFPHTPHIELAALFER
ncbi:MAG: hypothetical protein KatS3mg124_2235 [Porticoccaceae bacterium]|nr:MAG: hypothetical protein KatS3mg124_2235 [Porticoccaceae bacterium]